jgi:hypothetical protein
MARSEADLRKARRDAAALRPGTLLTSEPWDDGSFICALVIRRMRMHGNQFYELLFNCTCEYKDCVQHRGINRMPARDILKTYKVHHEDEAR